MQPFLLQTLGRCTKTFPPVHLGKWSRDGGGKGGELRSGESLRAVVLFVVEKSLRMATLMGLCLSMTEGVCVPEGLPGLRVVCFGAQWHGVLEFLCRL